MTRKPELFLDNSALFAGLWSESGGTRQLLTLGELGLVGILASPQVFKEIEAVLRAKAPQTLGSLALLLDRAQIQVVPSAPQKILHRTESLVHHPGDARVIADAWAAEVDFLVTLDKQHFLENEILRLSLPFPLGTPGDALAWTRDHLPPGE
jgi:predicted nucleic acid-binding protein